MSRKEHLAPKEKHSRMHAIKTVLAVMLGLSTVTELAGAALQHLKGGIGPETGSETFSRIMNAYYVETDMKQWGIYAMIASLLLWLILSFVTMILKKKHTSSERSIQEV